MQDMKVIKPSANPAVKLAKQERVLQPLPMDNVDDAHMPETPQQFNSYVNEAFSAEALLAGDYHRGPSLLDASKINTIHLQEDSSDSEYESEDDGEHGSQKVHSNSRITVTDQDGIREFDIDTASENEFFSYMLKIDIPDGPYYPSPKDAIEPI